MLKRELKINFKSLILWTIILAITYIAVFLIYPSLMNEQSAQSMKTMIESMPQEMLSAFNMDIVGIESAYGWFKTEGFIFLTLIGGLYAAIMGSTILLKEENDKTIEFLYSKPISRNNIVSSKILCGILNITLFTGIITISNYIFLNMAEDFDTKQFFMISLLPILLYYMLFFITLFISTFLKKNRKSMSLAIALVFVSYLMQVIGSMGKSTEIFKQLSLFEFVSSRYIILNDGFDMKYIIIGIAIILISVIGTYVRYNKKEFQV